MSPRAAGVIDRWTRNAISHAVFEQLQDGDWYARVPGCTGAVATGGSRRDVEDELFSVLGEWALLGMKLGDEIPVFGEVDLNAIESPSLGKTCLP